MPSSERYRRRPRRRRRGGAGGGPRRPPRRRGRRGAAGVDGPALRGGGGELAGGAIVAVGLPSSEKEGSDAAGRTSRSKMIPFIWPFLSRFTPFILEV